jgi:SWI/SNF-related matrix-associated actin-dependent regulator of chromatin subfamily A member 5
MLDRIRRKLFLSVKVMGSDNPSTTENSTLRSSELMDILRRGSSALSDSNDGMDLVHFLDSKIADILEYSRSREEVRVAKMKQEVKGEPDAEIDESLLKDVEEEEKRLLSGIAQVRCRLFEGKMVNRAKDNKDIATEWKELQKRARVDKIVMVDGMPMIAAHIMPEVVVVRCCWFTTGD